MAKQEVEAKLKEMYEARRRALFPAFGNKPILDGKEISWREFEEEMKNLKKMLREIMKSEDGWYYYSPVKDVLIENGKVVLGVCRGFDCCDGFDGSGGAHLMFAYERVVKSWDDKRVEYSGREIQSDERGIYARVSGGATPDEIAEGKYELREVSDTGSCHDLESLYAELSKPQEGQPCY